ncbi:hypothetical protein H0H93_006736 [Arthromyces matolae]|nr:hypothetical protein H0H93_006736 [Arthromyces matolae]
MALRTTTNLALIASYFVFSLLPTTSALRPDGRLHGNMLRAPGIPRVSSENAPVVSRNGTTLPPYNTVYYFDQLIDHNNKSLGTFKQRYWHTYEFYEPGMELHCWRKGISLTSFGKAMRTVNRLGPVLSLATQKAMTGYDGYLTNKTINGLIAQQQNASTIVLEHRFYGFSNPYPDLSVKSLRVHTLQQAVDDLVYFAQNVRLPMPGGDQVTPDKAPWVLIGGSYSGALTSWTMVSRPGIFWAGYASSAVVEAILDFWRYFEPIRTHMPANCSADVEAVIAHVDKTFTSNNAIAIQALKQQFGLGNLTHLDDVAGALRNNLWDWQSLQPTTGTEGQFYQFCDALEVRNGTTAPPGGWGLAHALSAWGSYFKNTYYSILCNTLDVEVCLGTYDRNALYYTNTGINNAARSWMWIVCNEVGYLQEGAPQDHPTLVTRLVQPAYDLRQCQYMFPEAFPEPPQTAIAATNHVYKGWDVKLDRLFFANGHRNLSVTDKRIYAGDPWKDATVSATQHTVQSTPEQPIYIGDGFHCSDLKTQAGVVDLTIKAVQDAALGYFKVWLSQWTPNPQPHSPGSVESSPPPPSKAAVYSGTTKPISAFSKVVDA